MPRDYEEYDDYEEPPRQRPRAQQAYEDDDYDDYEEDEYDEYDDDGYDDDDYYDDDHQEPAPRRAPAAAPGARARTPAPRTSTPRDRRIYEDYQRSRASYRQRRAPVQQRQGTATHRDAVEAYRRRKARQGVAAAPNTPVRVARRAGPPPRQRSDYFRKAQRRKDKAGIAKSIVLLVILVIIFLVPFAANVMPEVRDVLMSDLTEPSPRLLPESAEYNLERIFSLNVVQGTVNYNLKVPIPYEIPGAQEIISFTSTPAGTRSGTDMRYIGSTSNAIEIVVTYNFKITTVKWAITPETSGTTADVPSSYDKYLGDEWKIKPSNPDINTLAREIAGDKETVYEKLKVMADWMRNNILYEKQRGWQPKDPLETLSDGSGDCDDQAILYASLARSQGIPAWLEMGALYDEFQKKWGGHAWLRAYVPLVGGGGMKVNMDPANKEFLVRDPWRLTEWEADGNGEHLQNYYTLWSFSYSGVATYDAGAKYMDMGYQRSTGTISDKPPGSGTQAWKDSWRIPGFGIMVTIPALTIGFYVVGRRFRNA